MSAYHEHREIISIARCAMPARQEGEPLFRQPWHARIFALMVTLVKDRRLQWKTFQERLAAQLRLRQSPHADLTPEEIDLQYFDCWLEAAEDTLLASGLLEDADIAARVEGIRKTVKEIRDSQLGH